MISRIIPTNTIIVKCITIHRIKGLYKGVLKEDNIGMMRIKLEEKERLDRFLDNRRDKGEDFKALVLKLLDVSGDIEEVSQIARVGQSTIYEWVREWNKKKSGV